MVSLSWEYWEYLGAIADSGAGRSDMGIGIGKEASMSGVVFRERYFHDRRRCRHPPF